MFTGSIDEYCEEVMADDPFKTPLYLIPENKDDLEWIIYLTNDQLVTQKQKKPDQFPTLLRELIFFDDFESIDLGDFNTKEEYLFVMKQSKNFFLKRLHDLIVSSPDKDFYRHYINGLRQALNDRVKLDDVDDVVIAAGKLWASSDKNQGELAKCILDGILHLDDGEIVAMYDEIIRPALDKHDDIIATGLFNGLRLQLTKDVDKHVEWLNREQMTEDEYADFMIKYKKENPRSTDSDLSLP